ncbi:DUF1837 domain-containing protein [Clostridium estertheticum]|uniref:HamA C-terminal domain-containing protein n=1 Tax=Clostridium estertheticum TaxID=238834 RepID=UPI001C0C8A46|nr:DUF1837 domain-containing protein [Clostridium estertheticum]MBU3178430.1 DUF1837 domain-containing protein [Clostridium estertheticum]
MKLFGANKIIKEHISEADLCTYLVGFDLKDNGEREYRINELVKLLVNVIPEFAFGHHCGETTDNTEIIQIIIEAAKAIYSIDEFQKVRDLYSKGLSIEDSVADRFLRRGEFGELILHLLLRDFHDTIPLISKIYFRDSYGTAVHGFDAVHIQENTKSLWLGESKLYTDGKQGVAALVNDVKEHFKCNYLNSEFAIISRKVHLLDNIPQKEYWIDLLSNSTTLSEQLDNITIPLLCTYESNNFTKFNDEKIKAFIDDYESEVRGLKEYFDKKNEHPLKGNLNIILLLFPIQSKKELVVNLHKKLSVMQSLGDIE